MTAREWDIAVHLTFNSGINMVRVCYIFRGIHVEVCSTAISSGDTQMGLCACEIIEMRNVCYDTCF